MNLSEKSAYLKGLMDGLKLDQEAPEGKMISGIVELLQEVTGAIGDLQENAEAVYQTLLTAMTKNYANEKEAQKP